MIAEFLHVGAPIWSICPDLQNLINISIDTLLKEIDDLPHASAVDIEHRKFICSEQEFSICFSAHLLKQRKGFCLVLVDLFDILTTAEDYPKHIREHFTKFIHLDSHLCSFNRVTWEQLYATRRI